MNVKGFIELHDCYSHAPFIVNVNAIESVSDKFIIYAQSGHNVDEHYDEILKLMETAQAERTGRWIDSPNIPECMVCSECLSDGLSAQLIAPVPDYYRYCPCCGAHMIGGDNNG